MSIEKLPIIEESVFFVHRDRIISKNAYSSFMENVYNYLKEKNNYLWKIIEGEARIAEEKGENGEQIRRVAYTVLTLIDDQLKHNNINIDSILNNNKL